MLTRTVRIILGLTAATPLLLVAACSNNDPVSPLSAAAGEYQMTLFRGGALPMTDTFTAADGITSLPNGGTVTWTDGTMVLSSDGTFVETNNYTLTPTGSTTTSTGAFVSIGRYSVSGTTFSLSVAAVPQQAAARSAIGTISASTIDYQEYNGVGFDTFEYKR
ncbi:MAG TPA: hypothetical protein VGQ98_07550 [Gemmatimonadaceae bacterium]|nr:hypothetical protein [Gemmatimonadaceae bacterium]